MFTAVEPTTLVVGAIVGTLAKEDITVYSRKFGLLKCLRYNLAADDVAGVTLSGLHIPECERGC